MCSLHLVLHCLVLWEATPAQEEKEGPNNCRKVEAVELLRQQEEEDGMEEVEEKGREVGSRGEEEEDTTVMSMLVMFEQWTVIRMDPMSLAQENGQGLPRKEQLPARQSRSTSDPSIARSFPSLHPASVIPLSTSSLTVGLVSQSKRGLTNCSNCSRESMFQTTKILSLWNLVRSTPFQSTDQTSRMGIGVFRLEVI